MVVLFSVVFRCEFFARCRGYSGVYFLQASQKLFFNVRRACNRLLSHVGEKTANLEKCPGVAQFTDAKVVVLGAGGKVLFLLSLRPMDS